MIYAYDMFNTKMANIDFIDIQLMNCLDHRCVYNHSKTHALE